MLWLRNLANDAGGENESPALKLEERAVSRPLSSPIIPLPRRPLAPPQIPLPSLPDQGTPPPIPPRPGGY